MTYRLGQERADEDDHGQTDFRGELRECDKQVDALFVANARQKEEIDRLKATVARVEAVAAEFEGMTGSGYRYMAAHIRDAIKVPNDRVEGRDAALSRRVPSHDGLCGNGSEVGAGDTAKG